MPQFFLTPAAMLRALERPAGARDADVQAHHFADGLYAKEVKIPSGSVAMQHQHSYAHLSILAAGSVRVRTDNGVKYYRAPACILIAAGINHEVTAFEDATWFCIHATDEKDPEKIDKVLIA